ncbi:ectodysplasin-A receptor-associated adapter protein-like isoform X1 [Acipenser oxyrinchus oxyrinchus]|uniref:Ectodysplasin-A receptor-associated adapter protein n=1 Tax=Acipenser oxyrinchus oxyrinchus TaxID=40147 RepID=A0AAD8GCD5_ACIOX|nr:ectodysplasin-A receptor-associated adapter protein-like isoform X1 [Acipenser oxyrinchus oxyrinchus]
MKSYDGNTKGKREMNQHEGHVIRGPVEDTDPSSFSSEMSLQSKYPVQDTGTPKDALDEVTLQLASVNLISQPGRIRQPEDNGSQYIYTGHISTEDSPCEKCCCSSLPTPPPMISDLMNDEDLLYKLQLKLDTHHPTVKNWRNFASKWGMSYDELCFLEHRPQQSPTLEFLLRNSEKTVEQLIDLCKLYRRIDVLKVLQLWVEKDWPKRWHQTY